MNQQQEFYQFFDSIGLESWIEPLTKLGVSTLKFLYLNFDDIIEDENELASLRQNRLHVKIILKKLKAKFGESSITPSNTPTKNSESKSSASKSSNENNCSNHESTTIQHQSSFSFVTTNQNNDNNSESFVLKLEPTSPPPPPPPSNVSPPMSHQMIVEYHQPPKHRFPISSQQHSTTASTIISNGHHSYSNYQPMVSILPNNHHQQALQSISQFFLEDASSPGDKFLNNESLRIPNSQNHPDQQQQQQISNPNPIDIVLEEKTIDSGNVEEKLIKMHVREPEEPKKNRFLDDWQIYGQIRFFDAANYFPELPRTIIDYTECMSANNSTDQRQLFVVKDYDAIKELVCQHIYQDLMRYFIWRMPIRFLHTAVDRLIQLYPVWDDGSPTKTDSFKKRVLEKYALFRRFKIPPDWVHHKYLILGKNSSQEDEDSSQSQQQSNNVPKKRGRKRTKKVTTTPMNNNNNKSMDFDNSTTTVSTIINTNDS